MAVSADQLAPGDFFKYAIPVSASCKERQIGRLALPRQMIPLHRSWMKLAAAINTWPAYLEADIPRHELRLSGLVLGLATCLVLLVVSSRVFRATRLAPGLVSISPTVELSQGLLLPAAFALLLCPVAAHYS
jgi:hypothetical protein